MHKYDLSILIPARSEMFLAKTVEGVLENIRGNTEVIVALDGEWSDPALKDDPRLTVIYFPESLGQRGATNQACRLSNAKYVMKLDAHCAVDEGFDVKLMDKMQDDWTIVPLMRNLHAFDWVCPKCQSRQYQGPSEKYKVCDKCGAERVREVVWRAKQSPRSTAFCFDKTLHFQYFNEFKNRPEGQGEVTPTLSLQGSCFMLTRKKYWELDICDEGHGSWGQQGVEVALKTWLSGGQVMCVQSTWYAHMFRTQGGDFSFPYHLSGSAVEKARKYSQNLWLNNTWPLAKHDLQWILDKFYPVPYWHEKNNDPEISGSSNKPSREIIFYTDNQLKLKYAHAVQKQLKSIGLPIVSASLKPMGHFGKNIHIPRARGMETYFMQIIQALEQSTAEIVYMCEHDVLYHPSHFSFIPSERNRFYYNQNFWRIRPEVDNLAVHWDANQVSGLVCYREYLLDWYKQKWESIQKDGFDRSYEPGGRNSEMIVTWKSEYPNIDIRHSGTLTRSKWSPQDFRDKSTCVNWQESTVEKLPGWNQDILQSLYSA